MKETNEWIFWVGNGYIRYLVSRKTCKSPSKTQNHKDVLNKISGLNPEYTSCGYCLAELAEEEYVKVPNSSWTPGK